MSGQARRRLLAVLALVVLASVSATAVPGGATARLADGDRVAVAHPDDSPDPRSLDRTIPERDTTVIDVAVFENGSARWELRVRTRLRTDEEVAEYRRFQSAFRNDTDSYLDPFGRRMTGVVDDAATATRRSMNATDFSADTRIQEVPRRWGVVSFRFRWDGFANVTDERVAVGDVFGGGLFLSENDSLRLTAPPGYEVAAVDPAPDEVDGRTLIWFGRVDFDDRRPSAAFAPASDPTTTAPDAGSGATATATTAASDASGGDGGSLLPVALGGLAVVLAGALVVGAARRRGDAGADGTPTADGAAGAGAASGAGGPPPDGPPEPAADPSELVTDEDRVRALLAERGGRMKQTDVADALDWSASKTSRVLSEMADGGAVEKLRIGRENVIDLVEDGEDDAGA